MALFRRRRSTDETGSVAAVDEFWTHWDDVRGTLAASVDAGEPVPEETAARVTERVQRIHPELTWEVAAVSRSTESGPGDLGAMGDEDPEEIMARMSDMDDPLALLGSTTSYALTLSGGPDDSARILTERWLRSAPKDAEWQFHPAYPADHEQLASSITWDDHTFDLSHAALSLQVDQRRGTIDAGVYHPDNIFLPEETQTSLAEHVVMLALGEDDYVRWIAGVEPLAERPLDPLPPSSLPAVVRQLTGGGNANSWPTLQMRVPLRGIVEFSLRHPLHRRDFPAFTLYVQVSLGFAHSDNDKRPVDPSVAALEEFVTRIDGILGDNGALIAQQTVGGHRQLHYYLDPESGVLPEVEAAVREWSEGRSTVQSRLDPEWQSISQLRTMFRRQLGS